MTQFEATLFDGKSSAARTVTVHRQGGMLFIREAGSAHARMEPLADCRITPPLGKTRRTIYLPGGAMLETSDQEAVAQLDLFDKSSRGLQWVHGLESKWGLVLGSLAGLVLCVWLFIAYGIPFLAQKAAQSVPFSVMESVSDRALAQLDGRFFEETALSKERISEVRNMFKTMADTKAGDLHFRLLFRSAPQIGANAFALPSGKILVTDELVNMADDNAALAGVLAHEMAHVKQRHGIRMVFQNAGVFFVVSALLGDVVSITSTAAALPTLLVERGYSRKFERQADRAAGKYLLDKMGSTRAYRHMLAQLMTDNLNKGAFSMISTHPATEKRIQQLKRQERDYARHSP